MKQKTKTLIVALLMSAVVNLSAQKVKFNDLDFKFLTKPKIQLPEGYKTFELDYKYNPNIGALIYKPFKAKFDMNAYKRIAQDGDFKVVFEISRITVESKRLHKEVVGLDKYEYSYALDLRCKSNLSVYNKEGEILLDTLIRDPLRSHVVYSQDYSSSGDLSIYYAKSGGDQDIIKEFNNEVNDMAAKVLKLQFDHALWNYNLKIPSIKDKKGKYIDINNLSDQVVTIFRKVDSTYLEKEEILDSYQKLLILQKSFLNLVDNNDERLTPKNIGMVHHNLMMIGFLLKDYEDIKKRILWLRLYVEGPGLPKFKWGASQKMYELIEELVVQ